jgi:RNA polymerase sigma-70 factor, ECF subfamily
VFPQPGSPLSADLRADLFKAIPHLRAFAISLTGNVDHADDLVQDAIVRGLSHLDSFTPGTNLQAWLFTILRNHFHTVAPPVCETPVWTLRGESRG